METVSLWKQHEQRRMTDTSAVSLGSSGWFSGAGARGRRSPGGLTWRRQSLALALGWKSQFSEGAGGGGESLLAPPSLWWSLEEPFCPSLFSLPSAGMLT